MQQRVSIARMPLPPGLSRRLVIQHYHTAPLRVQGRQKHDLVRKLAPGVADADVRDFEDDGDGGPATAHNTCLVRPTRQVPLMHVHYRPCASACRCGTTAIGWSGVTVVSDVTRRRAPGTRYGQHSLRRRILSAVAARDAGRHVPMRGGPLGPAETA